MGQRPSPAVLPALWIATACVVLGFARWPYGYFLLLRSALCAIGLFLLLGANLRLVDWERWAIGAFAVLYNPLLPVRIGEKEIWIGLNVATVVLFWTVGVRNLRDVRWQRSKAEKDKVYADAYLACLAAGGTKHEAYVAARKAVGLE